ncbi:creatininase family protein [Bradyrhizobium cytisi]|uniref:Creatininase family protein n=1 Tax=Bradyrhizobium cytisi TaxID=515489 RepID=A0A5S4VVE2_9BRAD|nr:creatininase family protein [Bradyrhizobium cytisi]
MRERAQEDAIVIVPVGALEQHGPHLPIEIDSLLGETVALRTARLAAAIEKVRLTDAVDRPLRASHVVGRHDHRRFPDLLRHYPLRL